MVSARTMCALCRQGAHLLFESRPPVGYFRRVQDPFQRVLFRHLPHFSIAFSILVHFFDEHVIWQLQRTVVFEAMHARFID